MKVRTVVEVATVVGLLVCLTLAFSEAEPFTAPISPAAEAYARRTLLEIGATNVVAATTFDWRAFDTFGEATLLLTAATGVKAILRRWLQRKRETGVC
jgi:multisubunit Na+/H+ antiporter MnhB subunit